MQKAFGPAGRKAFRDSYLAAGLICIALFFSTGLRAQVDTTQIRQQINAAGYDWKSGAFLVALRPPRDTFKLKVADSGAIAYVGGSFYAWTGYLWKLSSGGTFSTDSIPNANSITRGLLFPDLLFYFSGKVDSLTRSNDTIYQYRDGFDKYVAFILPPGGPGGLSSDDSADFVLRLDTLGSAVNKSFRFHNGAGGVRIMLPIDDSTSTVRSFNVNSSWASLDSTDNIISLNIPTPFTPSAGSDQLILGNGAGIDPETVVAGKVDQDYADAHYQARRPALDSNSYLQNGSVDNQLLWRLNDSVLVARGIYITGSGVTKTIRDSAIIYNITGGGGGASALADLSDVDVSGAAENDILALNASGTWEHTPGLIAELTDPADGDMLVQDGGVFVNRPALQVTLTDPADGDMLVKDGSDWVNRPAASVSLDGVADGDYFIWDAATSTIVPHTGGGGSGSYTFTKSTRESGGTVDLVGDSTTLVEDRSYASINGIRGWYKTAYMNLSSEADGHMLFYHASDTTWVNHAISGDFTINSSGIGAIGSGKVTNSMLAGSIDLTAKVANILPSANGGTNNAFFSVSGPASSAKTYTFPNANATILTSAAAVTVPQGGTGATSLSGLIKGNGTSAFSAATAGTDYYAPGSTDVTVPDGGTGKSSWTVGSIPYASASTTIAEIAPNTTSTRKFLQQTSTGAPTFVQPAEADIVFSDVTTGNASTLAHGYVKKLTGTSTDYYGGDGAFHAVPSATNIYNSNGTLSAGRTLGGGSNSLELGYSGSPLNTLSIYTDGGIDVTGAISYYESTNPTDANYSATLGSNLYVLPAITANRNLTLPTPASGAAELFFLNKNTSAYSWNLSTTLKDAAGNTVPSLANSAFYDLMYDPDDAVWLVKSVSGNGSNVPASSSTYSVTLANQANASSISSLSSNYMRVGNRVHVWGSFQFKFTSNSTATVITISLPFATATSAALGSAIITDSGGGLTIGSAMQDGAGTGALVSFISFSSGGGGSLFSTCQYQLDYIIQ